jgi:uncharacterized protein YbjT (DUF2867 family)
MFLITGASGTVGTHVVRLLAERDQTVRAMTRDRAKVPASRTVEVVQADFDDPVTLRPAVDGVEAVFLLTAPQTPTPQHELAMLDAARSAGVSRIVKLSAIATGTKIDENTTLGEWHLLAEQAVQASGMAWTLLRPSTFASNFLRWVDTINAGEPIPNLTGTGTQGVIDPRDVAAVAVEALLSPVHVGQTYTLTGPELLSVPDQADRLEHLLGRPVTTVDLPLDEARAQMLASGMDSSVVDLIITGSAWVRAGHNAILTDDVTRVLGRPPASFDTWAHDHRHAFSST